MSSSPSTHSANPPESGAQPLARAEILLAACAFFALALAVLWRPVSQLATHTLGHWDMLTSMSSLTHEGAAIEPANRWTSDPVRQMLPWTVFAASELDAGRAPLWNPYNGTGTPLIANYQSALFSPFQWPFYVLPLKFAVLAASLAKLWLAGFAMYLFLRYVGLSRAGGAIGGLVYFATGSNLTILLFPHPAVSAWLPLGLIATEWLVRRAHRASSWRDVARPSVTLALVMAIAALSGHPETLAANALGIAAWAVARWIGAARSGWRLGASGLAAAAVLAGLLAAPQIAPFLEYYALSRAREGGPRSASLLGWSNWPLLVFPDLAGSPMRRGAIAGLPFPNHQEVMSFFVGGPALLVACVAPWFVRRDRAAWVFVVFALGLFVLVYDVAGAGTALHSVFSGHTLPLIRLNPLWMVSIAALAAWTIDRLSSVASVRSAVIWSFVAFSVGFVFRAGATRYIAAQALELELGAESWLESTREHRAAMMAWFALAACSVTLLLLVRGALVRWIAVAIFGVAQFASTAGVLAGYTPTVADELVLPRTRSLETLREHVGDQRVVFLGPEELTADSNCALGVRTVTSFDALEIARYQRLMAHFFGEQRYDARTLRASVAALRLFGVRYVAAPLDWLGVDTQLGSRIQNVSGAAPYLALARRTDPASARMRLRFNAQTIRQVLRPESDGWSGLVVHFVTPAKASLNVGNNVVELVLRDIGLDLVLERRTVDVAALRRVSANRSECAVTFEPIADSAGRSYELAITPDSAADAKLALWRASGATIGASTEDHDVGDAAESNAANEARDANDTGDADNSGKRRKRATGEGGERARNKARDGWQLLRGESDERGRIVLDLAYGSALRRVGDAGRHAIFEVAESAGRAWFAERVIAASDSEHAWELVTDPSFDPKAAAIVEGATSTTSDSRAKITALEETPTRSLFRVDVPTESMLIVTQAHYPGWCVRIDGATGELLRANYAFCAIRVPAGAREIELEYQPGSLRLGLLCAALGALAAIGGWLAARGSSASKNHGARSATA